MDETTKQAEDTRVPAADQAPSEASAETPTVSAEQGVGDTDVAATPSTEAESTGAEPTGTESAGTETPEHNGGRSALGVAAAVGAALGAAALGAAALSRARQNDESIGETLGHLRDEAGETLQHAAERVSETVSGAAEAARDTAAGAVERVRDAAEEAHLGERAQAVAETVGHAAEGATERVRDIAEDARTEAQHMGERVAEAASSAAETVRDTASEAAERVRDAVDEAHLGERVQGVVQAARETAEDAATRVRDASEDSISFERVEAALGAAGGAVASAATPSRSAETDRSMDHMSMEEALTMEDVLAASDEQLARAPVHRGMITTGSIIMLAQEGIVVDVGAKIEGMLPYNQLFEFDANAETAAKYFKAGDEIQVYVVRADIPNNTIILSKKRADQERAWNLLQDIHDRNLPVEVEIVEKVRGGLVANLGVRAFLPASQVDIRRVNELDPYVGRRLKVKIIELNRKRNRVIVSRRAILEEEVEELKAETLKKLEPGLTLEGEVVEITDFGAFVNLGGVDGLVHRSELTHGRFNHPREVIKLGQKVRVEVLDMDLERERINLSMKKLVANPWENVLMNYHIGQRVAGRVTNLTPFGAFVEIEPGLEGLIHVSEMSWTKRVRHPKEIVSEGDEVEAMILKVDKDQERISLGLRQTQPDPWSSLPDRYPPGTEVTGPITGITDFGVFMEIEEGIEGLVHISELAHEHIEQIEDHFQKGEEITAVILNIDPVEQRASLSRKRLMPYTASEGADMPLGAPQSRGGGRKGRRGGRRSAGIDYDYSYAQADPAAKATTKLGDVYADLFAQFGLTDKKDAEAPAKQEAAQEPQEAKATQADAPTVTRADTPAKEPQTAETAEPQATQADARPRGEAAEDSDPENAIDAAEAAALLTAAFREGRRPAARGESQDAPQDGAEETEKTEA
jgi:small subunit ribosomal protein S1